MSSEKKNKKNNLVRDSVPTHLKVLNTLRQESTAIFWRGQDREYLSLCRPCDLFLEHFNADIMGEQPSTIVRNEQSCAPIKDYLKTSRRLSWPTKYCYCGKKNKPISCFSDFFLRKSERYCMEEKLTKIREEKKMRILASSLQFFC